MSYNLHFKVRFKIGLGLLSVALLLWLLKKALVHSPNGDDSTWWSFSISICGIGGSILLIPFEWLPIFFFDNQEYNANKSLPLLVAKIRMRAILFNNLSILVFGSCIAVIVAGFTLLSETGAISAAPTLFTNQLLIKLGLITLIIFLVGILFRAFKYLLRVAAFYNGRADGLEISMLKEKENLKEMMTTMSPDSFDISDLPEGSILQSMSGLVKK